MQSYHQPLSSAQALEKKAHALDTLDQIESLEDGRLGERFNRALELAKGFLNLEVGLINRIESERCYTIWIVADDSLNRDKGAAYKLPEAFCSRSLNQRRNAFIVIEPEGPSSQAGTYIGTAVNVLAKLYGSLCFASTNPGHPFDDVDTLFVRMLGRWVEGALEREIALERMTKLISQVPGVVYQFQQLPDGRVSFPLASPGIKDIYRVTPEQVQEDASAVFDVIHPEDLDSVAASIEQSSKTLSLWDMEYRTRFNDGTERWLRGSASPERLSNGVTLWHGYIRDITEEKAAEQQMLQSEARLRGLFALSPLGIALNDFETGAFIEINDAMVLPGGYTKEEFIRLSFWEITPREYEPQEAVQLENLKNTGRYGPYEKEYLRKDGGRYPVRLNGMLITDPSGRKLIWSIVEDISESREQQRALQVINERLSLAAESARFGVWEYDLTDNSLQWDVWMFRLYGIEENEFTRAYDLWERSLHPDDRARAEQELQLAISGERNFDTEFRILWPNGQVRHIKAAALVTRDQNGKAVRMTGVNYDITERKQSERLKNEFVSIVSHELRTPLTSISGSLSLLKGGALGELPHSMRDMIDIAHKNSERLTTLINDLLDMEKLVAGKMPIELKRTPILPVVQQSISHIQGFANAYDVSVTLDHDSDPANALVDPERMSQILNNFLSNAIKYSPKGGQVELKAIVADQRVRILVTDHGPGIPEEFQNRIFQKFAQADSSDTRQKGGTGLGLAISKRLAEQMGGTVGFESIPDQKTTFFVEWPLV